jgi:hypothetical protein
MFSRDDKIGWKQSTAFKKAFSVDVEIEFVGVWYAHFLSHGMDLALMHGTGIRSALLGWCLVLSHLRPLIMPSAFSVMPSRLMNIAPNSRPITGTS